MAPVCHAPVCLRHYGTLRASVCACLTGNLSKWYRTVQAEGVVGLGAWLLAFRVCYAYAQRRSVVHEEVMFVWFGWCVFVFVWCWVVLLHIPRGS